MENKGKGWLIAVIVIALLLLVGSCDGGTNKSGTLHQGICSHCNGSGCGWCDGYGFWSFYD